MSKTKQRTEQHLIDAEGERLLDEVLPDHWVLRKYRPDYGLDFTLELFDEPDKKTGNCETLGEHFFIQLKSTKTAEIAPLTVYGRGNVEKAPEKLNKNDIAAEIDTVRIVIEASELATIERMGLGLPVLLVVADITSKVCYFVCLNDYIDKILIPRHDNYLSAEHRTIHLPVANNLADQTVGAAALHWYGKRSKLQAAFQRFHFQNVELSYTSDEEEFFDMARYFARRIVHYDFWDNTPMCELIGYYGTAVRRFLESGSPGLMKIDEDAITKASNNNAQHKEAIMANLRQQEIAQLWQFLSILPRNYEDIWREWFLPTSLGLASSYPPNQAHKMPI